MTQLAIELPYSPALGRADFFVSRCNEAAFEALERWPDRRSPVLVLYGPSRCGKSHLVRLWTERRGGVLLTGSELPRFPPDDLAGRGAVAIDDAEHADEHELLHLHNCCAAAGTGIVIVARRAPAAWPIALPDLASRLRAAPTAAILPPDDGLLGAVLLKHFADRQLRVEPDVIRFLLPRIERSFAAAAEIAARLDAAALRLHRPITVALARETLAETGS